MSKIALIRILTLSSILFYAGTPSFSQDVNVMDKNAKITFTGFDLEKSSDVTLIGAFKTPDGYVVFKKEPIRGPGGWHYFLQRFDNNMKSVNVMDVSEQFEHDKYSIEQITKVGNSYVLISTRNNAEKKEINLYAQRLEWDRNKLEEPIEIYSEPRERMSSQLKFEVNGSRDEKHLLIVVHPPYKANEKEKFFFKVYDENLEEVLSREEVEFEETDRAYTIRQIEMGVHGELYILGSKFRPADRKAGIGQGPTEYEITTLTNQGRDEVQLDLKEKIVADIALYVSDKNELFVSGYYRKKDGVGIDGVFLFSIDPKSGEINESISDEFSQEFITEGWSDRQVKKAEKKKKGAMTWDSQTLNSGILSGTMTDPYQLSVRYST